MVFRIHKLAKKDMPSLFELFYNTVHNINLGDYSQSQVNAWAPQDYDENGWPDRVQSQITYCLWAESSLGGFCSLRKDGYLDMLFVSHLHQRKGIASMLVSRMLFEAKTIGLSRVHTEASITAKPFFSKMGFKMVREQEKSFRGEVFTNNVMEIHL